MQDPEAPASERLIIGTYTEKLPHVDGKAEGVLAASFRDGVVGDIELLAPTRNPSFVACNAGGDRVYVVHETMEFEGRPGGSVTAFRRELEGGALVRLNSRPSAGVEPCHVTVDPSGRFVLVSNYHSGSVAVFALEPDGSLGEMTDHDQHAGASVDPVRQSGPHAHMALFDPVTGEVVVADLGLDALVTYALDDDGRLHERSRVAMVPGAGPRHLAFHPGGNVAFVVNELDNTVVILARGDRGFVAAGATATLPGGFSAHSQTAAIRVAANGRFVLVSNRGEASDSIAVLAFDDTARSLELVHLEPSGGREPRDFVQSPDARYLVVANQDSDSVVTFEFDQDDGKLRAVSQAEVPTPACLLFA